MARTFRSPRGVAQQADFAVCLFVFFLITFFPLIDLLGVGLGTCIVAFGATQCASRAANSNTYTDAVQSALSEIYTLAFGGFGRFALLSARGGLGGTGLDLYVYATDTTTGQVKVYGPNAAVSDPIDSKNIYEYCAHTTFDCGPLVNLSSVPFLGDVPGLGKPFTISYSAFRAAEFSDGLAGTGTASGASGASAPYAGPYLISFAGQTNSPTDLASGPGGVTSANPSPTGTTSGSGGWGPPPTTPPKPGDWWYGRGPWANQVP